MSPSVVPFESAMDHTDDIRPSKRPRKGSEATQEQFTPGASSSQTDHVFISETLASKKQGGKKAPLSCCECRRLKLKCDRTFPCGSCKKRGVSDICPDGVLVSGKGTRFILANTEQLHAKIQEMSEHIRRLEEALESTSSNPHPLLQPDMLNVKSTMELYGVTQTKQDGISLPVSSERTGEQSMRQNSDGPESRWSRNASTSGVKHESVDRREAEILRLGHSFPMGDSRGSPEPNVSLRDHIRSRLPPRQEAEYLWQQTKENALWQYNPHPDETFFPNLAHHCYASAPEDLSPRRLALLLMILAVGCLVDLQKRGPESPDAEYYHTLGRAALSEVSVMEDTTVETITALFYEIWFLLVFSDKRKGTAHAWGLMGLTTKLAQSIGLHRNGVKSKVIPEEVEKRRSLFWELLYLDARLSLSLGRPPSLSIKYMDCQRPTYVPDANCDPLQSTHYYQEWKHTCYVHCLAPVLDALSQPGLEYDTVLALDARVRDFSVPAPLHSHNPPSRTLLMQKASIALARETVLLQLHRNYLMRALNGTEEPFNRRNRYAPSVVAVILSASRMIATVEDLYAREPQLTTRITGYWSNTFSAAVAISLLVCRAPFTCLSPAGLQELERVRLLFKAVCPSCPKAREVMPMLDSMIGKTNDIFRKWYAGEDVPTMVLRHTDVEPFADDYDTLPYNSPPTPPPSGDAFAGAHSHLSQCIAEAHDRAKIMFPMRKPCQCSLINACPPSHSWAPPPPMEPFAPVLPHLYPTIANPLGFDTASDPNPPIATNFTGVDTINFELGALHPNTAQSWMAWF